MCNCTACCMQEWQESSLCSSPTAADLSKDIPASCILLMSPLHQPAFVLVLIHLKCVWVMFELNTLVWLVEGPVLACKTTYFRCLFDSTLFLIWTFLIVVHLFYWHCTYTLKQIKFCHYSIWYSSLPFVSRAYTLISLISHFYSLFMFPLYSVVFSPSMYLSSLSLRFIFHYLGISFHLWILPEQGPCMVTFCLHPP